MVMSRRPVLLAVIIIVGATVVAEGISAQDFGDRKARAGLTIGPGFSGGASMIIESAEGWKVKPVFAWRGEASATYPLTTVINAGLSLGVDSRGTRSHHFKIEDLYTDTRVTYFSLVPDFTFSGFSVGFNFGFPLSGWTTYVNGSTSDIDGKELPTLLEAQIGGVIPIVDDDLGWLSLTILGGFTFSELVDYPEPVDTFGDWRHVALQLGLRFEFLIPDTERK